MNEIISKKYTQLLDRSFKSDLKLFFFGQFLKGEMNNCNENNYSVFSPDEFLTKKYQRIKQLSKESDPIPDTDIEVGNFDKALKLWIDENKSKINLYKNIYKEHRFISTEDFESFY